MSAGNNENVVLEATPVSTRTSIESKKWGTVSEVTEYKNGNKEVISDKGNFNFTRGDRILGSQGNSFIEGTNVQVFAKNGILEIGGTDGISFVSGTPDEYKNEEAKTQDEAFRQVRAFRTLPQDNRDTPSFNPIGDLLSISKSVLNSVSSSNIKIQPPTLTGNIITDMAATSVAMAEFVSQYSTFSLEEQAIMAAKYQIEKYQRMYEKVDKMMESDPSFKNKVKNIKDALMGSPATDKIDLEEADGWYDKYLECNMIAFEKLNGGDTYNK